MVLASKSNRLLMPQKYGSSISGGQARRGQGSGPSADRPLPDAFGASSTASTVQNEGSINTSHASEYQDSDVMFRRIDAGSSNLETSQQRINAGHSAETTGHNFSSTVGGATARRRSSSDMSSVSFSAAWNRTAALADAPPPATPQFGSFRNVSGRQN